MARGDRISSPVWGNGDRTVSQDFGQIDPETASMYPAEYTVPLGYPAGTHVGLDIEMPTGTPIYALNSGVVEQGGPEISQYFRPRPVWIRAEDDPNTRHDEDGYIEIYGHLWENTVQPGQRVRIGQQIGISGQQTHPGTMTPDGTGEHLHFEVRAPNPHANGTHRAINPTRYLQKMNVDIDDGGPDAPPPGTDPSEPGPLPENPIGDVLSGVIADNAKRVGLALIGIVILAIGLRTVF